MTHKNNRGDILERIADELADSVLSHSDEAFLVEAGTNTEEEAEHTRMVLREALRKLENVDRCLSHLGHRVDPNEWHRGGSGYSNMCVTCCSFVSFNPQTGEMRGDALRGRCCESDQHTIRRRQVSGE
jgi:hypothetical protein